MKTMQDLFTVTINDTATNYICSPICAHFTTEKAAQDFAEKARKTIEHNCPGILNATVFIDVCGPYNLIDDPDFMLMIVDNNFAYEDEEELWKS